MQPFPLDMGESSTGVWLCPLWLCGTCTAKRSHCKPSHSQRDSPAHQHSSYWEVHMCCDSMSSLVKGLSRVPAFSSSELLLFASPASPPPPASPRCSIKGKEGTSFWWYTAPGLHESRGWSSLPPQRQWGKGGEDQTAAGSGDVQKQGL